MRSLSILLKRRQKKPETWKSDWVIVRVFNFTFTQQWASSMKINTSQVEYLLVNCPLGLSVSSAVCYIDVGFSFNIWLWLKENTTLFWCGGYFFYLSGKTISLWIVWFQLKVYFSNWEVKLYIYIHIYIMKMKKAPAAWLWLEHKKRGVVSPRPPLFLLSSGRCWSVFRSGAAWQPWSRSCFDAAACSSTAPRWVCNSWLTPSGLTPAPRGQRLAGNKFLKETCFDFHGYFYSDQWFSSLFCFFFLNHSQWKMGFMALWQLFTFALDMWLWTWVVEPIFKKPSAWGNVLVSVCSKWYSRAQVSVWAVHTDPLLETFLLGNQTCRDATRYTADCWSLLPSSSLIAKLNFNLQKKEKKKD